MWHIMIEFEFLVEPSCARNFLHSYEDNLKVFSNEKRGGLRVISFDRPPFKLFSRKFSKDSVQASSCERHKTTQRTPVSIICKQLLIPNIG
jgi:hypothetical protein